MSKAKPKFNTIILPLQERPSYSSALSTLQSARVEAKSIYESTTIPSRRFKSISNAPSNNRLRPIVQHFELADFKTGHVTPERKVVEPEPPQKSIPVKPRVQLQRPEWKSEVKPTPQRKEPPKLAA